MRRVRGEGLGGRVRLIHGDVFELDRLLGGVAFDAAYMVWSSILGYGVSKECDSRIFSLVARLVKPGRLLVIANTASYDTVGFIGGVCS